MDYLTLHASGNEIKHGWKLTDWLTALEDIKIRSLSISISSRDGPTLIANSSPLSDYLTETDMEERREDSKLDANVEAKIKELLVARGVVIENIDMCPATVKGDNYLGVLTNLNIVGDDSDGAKVNLKWIVKSAPKIEALRDLIKVDLLYAREMYVYEEIFELFKQFQENKALQRPYHDYPKFVGSYADPPNESIVMENMKTIGYVMRDRRQPLDLNHVMLVMKSYGKLHSLSYAIKDQNYNEFQRIVKNSQDGWFVRTDYEEVKKAHEPLMEESLIVLKSEDQRIKDIYCKFIEKSVDVARDAQKASNNDPFSVIVHGDSWINNLLFKYDVSRNTFYLLLQSQIYHRCICKLQMFFFSPNFNSVLPKVNWKLDQFIIWNHKIDVKFYHLARTRGTPPLRRKCAC